MPPVKGTTTDVLIDLRLFLGTLLSSFVVAMNIKFFIDGLDLGLLVSGWIRAWSLEFGGFGFS